MGQGQIDGAAGGDVVMAAHVRLAFVDRHLETTARQEDGQQAASQTSADQSNLILSLHKDRVNYSIIFVQD